MSKMLEFKAANIERLNDKWNNLKNKDEYTPSYQAGYNSGFTHFVASEFCNHCNKGEEYAHV